MLRQGATHVRAIDDTRPGRRVAACAVSLALALAGCSLNPQPDDPNIGLNSDPRNHGGASGMGGSNGFAAAGMMPPPSPGAGGTVFGISDAAAGLGGSAPIATPVADAGADSDAAPVDSGDAEPDRRQDPTRD